MQKCGECIARLIIKALPILVALLFGQTTIAAIPDQPVKTSLPGSVQPGRITQELSTQIPQPSAGLQPIAPPESSSAGALGPDAERITFKLTQVVLEGNTVYSSHELSKLYADKLNTKISIAELQKVVESITNYYRNNGYILSRAILPPQRVDKGRVRIQIIEGYIEKVTVVGNVKGSKKLLLAFGQQIANSRPLQIKVMEHYLRLANDIPGVQVKAVLEPSKKSLGASDMSLTVEEETFGGYVSYDNYGTRYLGPQQDTVSGNMNSMVISGDTTQLTYVQTTRPQQLQYMDFSYNLPIDDKGTRFIVDANSSNTQPGLNLASLKMVGDADTYYAKVRYPIIRARDQNLTLEGSFNYVDSYVTTFSLPLYTDHLRTVVFGANYDFSDRFYGSNFISLLVEQGLNILGASHSDTSLTTSRYGGHGDFLKFTPMLTRSQALMGRYSLFGLVTGQLSFNPLLSSEQFGFGGNQLGRAYDPAEIIGDRGFAGSVEFRSNIYPEWRILAAAQLYLFYDAGVIWNMKNVQGIKQKQSATSTGFGARLTFGPHITGNFIYAQPLTKSIASLTLVGQGRMPRMLFNITASF